MDDQSQFDSFVVKLRKLVDQQIRPAYQWYWTHTMLPQVGFRVAGAVVLIGSLTLPVITQAKGWSNRDAVLTAVSLVVAILSSLNTFFRWDSMWQTRTKTANELQGLLARWELALTTAEMAPKPQEAALSATQKLFEDTFGLVSSETTQFFTTVKWPDSGPK